MKKFGILALCVALLLCAGCIKIIIPAAENPTEAPVVVTEAPVDETAAPTEEPTPEPTPYEPDLSLLPIQFNLIDWPIQGTLLTVDLGFDGEEETYTYLINEDTEKATIYADNEPMFTFDHGRYIDHITFVDLDPSTPYANILVVIDWGSEDYVTYVLHPEKGKLVQDLERNDGVFLTSDGMLVEWIQTDLLGTKFGTRQVAGEQLLPYSEWIDSTRIPTKNDWTVDRQDAIDTGLILHATRDVECTVDGQKTRIKTGTYLYPVRWNESLTLVEVCTEDGMHAMIAVELLEDEYGFEFLLYGVPQDDCFDNLLYAD